ncbi:nuclear transport factor 2 family protein [Streptomyces scabiei]|uniref:nuclear transport factor 2 family protein n=1 Tax=Streptomyces scabiei TaxID=1930 RepID=UPI00068D9377|nr:nuclear transport factor 2 family protein [Streptomyces scabiei]
MTTTHPWLRSPNIVRVPETVAQAEAAWLVAITKGDEEQRALMLPDCVFVHGPVGNVRGHERFLGHGASVGPTVEVETSEVACVEPGGRPS